MRTQIWCNERDGPVLRTVTMLNRTPALILYLQEQLGAVRNFLPEKNPLGFMLEPNTILYLVDDVGVLAAVDIVRGYHAHAHITFWDGRLRGREELTRLIAFRVMDECELNILWTAVPSEARVAVAFARRVGFRKVSDISGVTVLQLDRRSRWEWN